MSVKSGRYVIANVKQKNFARLPDPNDDTAVMASHSRKNLDAHVSPLQAAFYIVLIEC